MPVVADCSRFVKIKMGDNCFEVVPSPTDCPVEGLLLKLINGTK